MNTPTTDGLVPHAMEWFNNLSEEQRIEYQDNNPFLFTKPFGEIILSIWMEEVVSPWVLGREGVHAYENTNAMAIAYLKEQEVKEVEIGKLNSWGKPLFYKEETTPLVPKEEPVSPVFIAAKKESEDYGHNMKDHIECAFLNGASWQQSQDKLIIQELRDALVSINGSQAWISDAPTKLHFSKTVLGAIDKANEYLK